MGIIINGQNDTIGPVDNSMSLLGTVSIGGTMTIEDFTNIDSVGLITARNGVNVTAGDVNLTSGNLALASATPMVVASNGSGSLRLGAGGSEKVRINSAGNIGIASDTPAARLDVYKDFNGVGAGTYAGRVYGLDLGVNETGVRFVTKGTGDLHNASDAYLMHGISNGTTRFVFGANGNVGINETSPDTYLHVKTGTDSALAKLEQTATNGRVQIQYLSPHGNWYQGIVGASNSGDYLIYTGQSKNLTFHTNGELRQKIQSDGKVILGGNANQSANRDLSVVATPGNSNEVQLGLQPTNSSGGYNPEVFISAISDGTYGAHMYFKTRDTSGNRLERLRITSGGNIGIGEGTPLGKLHIKTGDSGASSVGASADELVIEGSGNSGLTILSATTGEGLLNFGDSGDVNVGSIVYNHSTNSMQVKTADVERLSIKSTGDFYLAWNDGQFVGQYYSADYYMGLTFGSNNRELYIDNRANDTRADIVFRTIQGQSTPVERLRITSDGQVQVSNTVSSNDAAVNIYKATGSNSDKAILRVGYNAAAAFEIYRIRNNGDIFAGPNQSGSDFIFQSVPTGGSTTERLRIQDDGKVLIYGSLGAGYLPLGGNAASAALQIRGTTQYQGIAFGQSASNATIGIDNTKLVYTANANPANLGGGVQTAHEWWSGSSGGGGPSKIAEMNTSGQLYLGGYPLTHTVAAGSNLKLRAGSGAWGISIGMRSPENDYAYIGFHDKDGTEQIADINVQRTGANTGHMVFSTNNGSGGSESRLRIADSGRLCYSPDSNFAAESTNIAMSIIASGGDIAGYPGIHLRSTDSGGGTNSMNGMSIVSTDANFGLYSNAGNVHGLGLFAGNSASSGNCGFYLRSDKKITMGPQVHNEASTTNTCGQAVHIAGGSLGIGAVSNYTTRSGEGGRYVLGWYHANAYTGRSGNSYLHLVTSLWGGGSPHGQSEFIMGGFKIKSYRYSPAGVAEEIIMFHNWSGSLPGYSREHNGTWDPGNAAYVNSNGYVTIRLNSQNYVGYIIDLIQYNWYPVRDITVTAATFSNSSSI